MNSAPKNSQGELTVHSCGTLEKIAETIFPGWVNVHACMTGDCPHTVALDCMKAIYQMGFVDAVQHSDQWINLKLERFSSKPDGKS